MRGRITALALLGLLVLAGPGVLLRPVATQPAEKVRRIGLLGTIPPPIFDTFRSTLRDLGWIEGRNLSIERRVAGSDGQLDAQAADLARLKVDVIVAPGPVAVRAARAATSTTPIVMIAGLDPVATGLVTSLARPGGNVTGFTVGASTEVLAKWIELLRDAVPTTPRIALLVDRHQPAPEREANLQRMEAAARSLRIPLQQFLVGGPDQFESALTAAVASGSRAMAVMTTPMLDVNQERIIALTLRHRLPSIAFFGHYATAGGLISYGPDLHSLFRATAAYVDRILKGVSAGDLPVQQPPQPRLVLNLKTAQALGLALPPSLLLRADQVIE
jgi:putative ABC transport system substrate-binding protein